jgi:hypothetical protein
LGVDSAKIEPWTPCNNATNAADSTKVFRPMVYSVSKKQIIYPKTLKKNTRQRNQLAWIESEGQESQFITTMKDKWLPYIPLDGAVYSIWPRRS